MPKKITFASGKEMKNEFMLAPLTNMQSLEMALWATMNIRG